MKRLHPIMFLLYIGTERNVSCRNSAHFGPNRPTLFARVLYIMYTNAKCEVFRKKCPDCFAGSRNRRTFASANEAYPFLRDG